MTAPQPIATAPRTGMILAWQQWRGLGMWIVVKWFPECGPQNPGYWMDANRGGYPIENLTHWAPLPATPPVTVVSK